MKRRLRHARRIIGYSALVLLILFAVLVGLLNQMLPWVEEHPEQIKVWLTQRIGEPVNFSKAKGEWTRRGPVFTLDDLRVGEGDQTLKVGHADLLIAIYSGLLPGEPLTELKINQLTLQLIQTEDRRWTLKGLPGQADPNIDPLEKLEGFGELQIEQAALGIRAPLYQLNVDIPRVDLRLRVSNKRINVGVSAWASTKSAPLSAVLDLSRDKYDGTVWVGGKDLDMKDWSPLLKATGIQLHSGEGETNAWANLKNQRITSLQTEADLKNIQIVSSKLITLDKANAISPDAKFDRLEVSAKWIEQKDGWQFTAPILRFHRDNKVASLDGLLIAGGKNIVLRAPQIDLQPAFTLLSLTDQLPDGLRKWLVQASPTARLSDVDLQGSKDGPWKGSVVIRDLNIEPAGTRPGLHGLHGRLQMDGQGGVFEIDSKPVQFLWPAGFRQNLDISLTGNLVFWRDGDTWTVGTSALQISGPDIGVKTRFQMGFQGDGTAPTLDLAADLQPATFTQAKKFWIMHKMPPATVKWLDTALVKGNVLNGRIVVNGDLDDWPFRNKEGVFDARARIRDAQIKFHPEWPQAQPLDVDVVFDGPGFSLIGSGVLMNNKISKVTGGIEDFATPWLNLDIVANGKAENLRSLVLASPLQKKYGEHVRAGTATGQADVSLNLQLPLNKALGSDKMSGTLDLKNASLSDSRWNIAFTDVTGRTRFDQSGFATENLKVQLDKRPAVFNLTVGSHTKDSKLAAIAALDGNLASQSLMSRYENVAWLKPYIDGNSNWSVRVDIPNAVQGKTPASQLSLSSDLIGTQLDLPAPLNKSASQSVALQINSAIPLEQGLITLRYGNVLHMRASQKANQPMNGVLQFGGEAGSTLPAKGLAARGKVMQLDAAGWIAFASGGEGASGLNEVNLVAEKLLFLDQPFANSKLALNKTAAGTRLQIDGTGIEGTIDISSDTKTGVLGRFSKLHMQGAVSPPATAATPASPAPETAPKIAAETDPSKVPPLKFSIEDLRVGASQLGKADLQTSQIANGMRIDRFVTKSKTFSINATGDWVKQAVGTRSSLKLDFTTDSLGKMMDAMGFVGMVQKGKTKAFLNASWPGSPGAMSMANLNGTLKVEVGEGRLLDVEPGGSGRILGLISLAEIPRRLTLDFSDFFAKGFSFNTMQGDITFSDGLANTKNLRINGPAAEIKVSGTADVRKQEYDQRIEVLPKAGGILPALGMLTGGPAGAAVGVAAQAVLQKPLKQTARVVYHVTGPWKKPKVEIVEKGPAKTNASDKPAPVGP
ncbi:MAG: YhdP family protein [Arenimonas sp.]